MIVALHSPPSDFFETAPPHSNDELLRFVRRASLLGFKAVQIGPLNDFVTIEGERLRTVLDSLGLERNLHVGGLYDTEKFALTDDEYLRARKEMRYGLRLCEEISSGLISIHPPFFLAGSIMSEEVELKARTRFLEFLREEVNFASRNHIRIALESFCYHPFIFDGLKDFAQFVSKFHPEKLGVLLDIGHVYQIGIDLLEAVQAFEGRLLDIHIHDARLDEDYRKATHLPIGKGTIDFPGFIDLLDDIGYDQWLTLEIRGSQEEIVQSKLFLENLSAR